MEYFEEVLDRSTGHLLSVSKGDWITISELAQIMREGPRRTRTILRNMNFLQVEGAATHARHRLCPWVIERGWGRRIEKRGTVPFDVIGPEARSWIIERWHNSQPNPLTPAAQTASMALKDFCSQRASKKLLVQEAICWLRDHYQGLSQTEIAAILDVTQQLVSKYLKVRQRQIEEWSQFKSKPFAS